MTPTAGPTAPRRAALLLSHRPGGCPPQISTTIRGDAPATTAMSRTVMIELFISCSLLLAISDKVHEEMRPTLAGLVGYIDETAENLLELSDVASA